jgi:replication factor A1
MQNYDALIQRVSEASGLEKEEVERKVEAKKAKLSGLISKEGAAQIIAAELGVNFDNLQLKISELMPGMKRVNIVAKIINLFPVREYEKNGKKGKIGSLVVADATGNLRTVLWDTNHIDLIEKKQINDQDVIEIKNATMRDNELHLSGFSEIKKSEVVLEDVKTEISSAEKLIEDLKQGENVKVRGTIVQVFNPRFFSVCPECSKKAEQTDEGHVCKEHGKVVANERALLNFVLDDGTETIRVVLFSDQLSKLVEEGDLKDMEKLVVFKDDLMGSEMWLSGLVKKNALFNNLEITGRDVVKVDVDSLVEDLEKGA